MSQILLYITLVVLAPADIGEGYELSSKSSVQGAVFSLTQEELNVSKIFTGSDGHAGLLPIELIVTDSESCRDADPVYLNNPLKYLRQYKHYIRGPPAVS